MKGKENFLMGLVLLLMVFMGGSPGSMIAEAATVSTTQEAETTATQATTSAATTTGTLNLHVVAQNDHTLSLSSLKIELQNRTTGASVTKTLDDQGAVAVSGLESGTYNAKLTDTYGNNVMSTASFSWNMNQKNVILLSFPVSKVKVIYQNNGTGDLSQPAYTLAGNQTRSYTLSAIQAGEALESEAGYLVNGTSCGVFATTSTGISGQAFLTVPLLAGTFSIRIDDRGHALYFSAS